MILSSGCFQKSESKVENLNPTAKTMKSNKTNINNDSTELRFITSEFMRCIKEKDKKTFLTLFYNNQTPWLGKFDAKSEKITLDHNPSAINAKGVYDISKLEFIDQMVSAPDSTIIEEKFLNLQIETDGYIASVNFDYEMFINNEMTNNGKEFWHLIKTNEGWKIVSVIYSVFY
jgi:hypothetical protein